MDILQQVLNFILEKWNQYGGSILYSIVVIIIGYILTKQVNGLIKKVFKKVDREDSIAMITVVKCIKYVIWLIVIMVILTKFQILETAIFAIISSAGLTLGLALKDTLSNIAKGIQIIITKPYGVGDYIEINNISGTVKKIQVIYTQINTDDNKLVIIPNHIITEDKIINYSKEPIRRLDLEFTIDYDYDINKIETAINDVIAPHPFVLKTPKPNIRAGKNIPGKIVLFVRLWTKTENYSELNFDMIEQIKSKLNENNIRLSNPNMNINIVNSQAKL